MNLIDRQSDTISRQAAIDAILHNQEVYSHNFGDDPIDKYTIAIIDNDAQTIAQLPSAEPVRCKDCRWGSEVCGNIECSVDSDIFTEYHAYEWFCPNGERKQDATS